MIEKAAKALTVAKVGALMAMYAGEAALGKALIKDEVRRKRFFIENVSKYCRRVLEIMNFDVEVVGYDPAMFKDRNFLLISNHMSYTDILCLSSVHPCIFVTSVDMGEAFFLGTMAELGGSIFVERRHRGRIDHDIEVIAKSLQEGFDVVIYPEGTSTNGDAVLPFKKSLLTSAVKAGVDVIPMVIKYVEIDGERFSEKNRDKVCWYGKMTFAPHLAGLLKLKSVKVRIEFLQPIPVTSESTRHELAEQANRAISEKYQQHTAAVSSSSVAWNFGMETPSIV